MVNRVILPLTNTERDGLTHAGCGCHLRHDGKGEAILDKSDLSRTARGKVLPLLRRSTTKGAVGDEEEGDEREETGEDNGDELFIKNDDEVATATFRSESDQENLQGYPPRRKSYPRTGDFIAHFIGDERKEKDKRKYK